jgi:signal transduction histidine kinase
MTRGRLTDVAITGGLLTIALAEIVAGDLNGPVWANAALMGAIALPVLWRRSHPEIAFVVSMTGIAALMLGFYSSGRDGPMEPYLVLIVMSFSLALHGNGRARAGGTTYGVLAFGAITARQLDVGTDLPAVLAAWIPPVSAWLVGWALQRRQAAAEHFRTRADEAERAIEEESRRAVALERARIARELHDMISHSVSVMVMQASVERRLLAESEPRTSDALVAIERAGRDALRELRTLLGVLRESGDAAELQPQPGLDQLPALVERVSAAGLSVELRFEGDPVELPPAIELSAYRIVQEGLTNVLKHAGRATADVSVQYERDRLRIEVRDDGAGANGTPPGTGLAGLRERVAIFGGEIDAFSPGSGGFVLRASLPTSIEAQ